MLINLIGYRRLGHNELDEPAYTQPVMSRTIKAHPPVSKLYAQKLIDEGVTTREEVDGLIAAAEKWMRDAHEAVTSRGETGGEGESPHHQRRRPAGDETAVPEDLLRALNEQLLAVPDGFTIHPKLVPQLARRREALGAEGGIAWAHAEALAFASLLVGGRAAAADRAGLRARHLQPAPPGAARRRRGRDLDARTPGGSIRPWPTSPTRRPRSSCSTAPSPRRRRSASSTATAPRRPRRWCCGRRSTATSSTAPRS